MSEMAIFTPTDDSFCVANLPQLSRSPFLGTSLSKAAQEWWRVDSRYMVEVVFSKSATIRPLHWRGVTRDYQPI
jgi:hypothetical protein